MDLPRTMPASRMRDRAAAGAFVVLWCSGYPAAKLAVLHAGPFTVLLLRFVAAAAIFALLALAARVARPSRSEIAHSAVVGLLSLAVAFGGVYTGLRLGVSTGITALLIGAMPLTTGLFASLLGERLGARQWIGLALGFAGVVLVLEGRIGGGSAHTLGYLASIAGLLGLTFGTLYQKRHATTIDMRVGLAVQHLVAAVAMLPVAAFVEHFAADRTLVLAGSLAWIVLVNAVGGFALLFALLRRGGASEVAALFYLMPPVTAVMGYFMFGERLTLPMIPGFVLVAFGVWLGTRRAAR